MEAKQPARTKRNVNDIVASVVGKIQTWLTRPTDAASLATFRVFFGAIMLWEVYRYHYYDRIFRYYIGPQFFFTYEMFPFVTPLPGTLMYLVFFVLGLSALGIMLGFFYRVSTIIFFFTYTYIFLLDKTQYNNHYYFICLLGFLFVFVDAHRWASIDQKLHPGLRVETVPFWQIFIFRAQVFIVYFYAAIAKLNADWLAGEPMRDWLAARSDYAVIGPFLTTETAVYFFSYGGLLFDLLIGFALLFGITRLIAFLGLLFFHVTNSWLFSIGIFPFLMIAATVVFVKPNWPRRVLKSAEQILPQTPLPPRAKSRYLAIGFVAVYLALQMLIPFRHWLYPGNVNWTEEGHRFAWRMKLRDKQGRIAFFITDPATNKTWPVSVEQDLTGRQIGKMSTRPDMILQYAHYLKAKAQQRGIEHPIITTDAWASLNGRPYLQLVDPTLNLAEVPQQAFARAPWILQLPPDSVIYSASKNE